MPGVDGVGGLLACLYRLAHPLPLGAGEYVRPAGVGLVCGEGVGVSLRFSLSRGSRGLSSCHLIISVVIASRSACFVAPPSSSSSRLMRVVLSHLSARRRVISPSFVVGLLTSPFFLCRHRPVSHVLCSCPLCSSCVRPASVFSCGFLSLFSPFLRRAGRGGLLLACLIRRGSRPVVSFFSSRRPRACLPS